MRVLLGSPSPPRTYHPSLTRQASGPDQLVAVDPIASAVAKTIDLEDCEAAHGVHLHPDARTAYVACEDNATLVRVGLDDGVQESRATTSGPDVLSIDPGRGWLYVAAEAGDTAIYEIDAPGVAPVATQDVGDGAHTVAVDHVSHRVYFPLPSGPDGTPVLRIMKPNE